MTGSQKLYLPEVLKGLFLTMGHVLKNLINPRRMPVIFYPEQKKDLPPTTRGRHRLMKREDGSPRCTACMLCATACPAECIHIQAGEHPDATVEKYPISFTIDELRCVFCGLCVEACPCDAIRMDTGVFALAAYKRENFLYPRNLLLGDDVPVNIAEGKAPSQ